MGAQAAIPAATGQIISTTRTAKKRSGQVIDGFIKGPRRQTGRLATKSADFHQRAQKAQTLMRGGLKKPARHLQSRIQRLAPRTSVETEYRSKTTPRHARVSRFGIPGASARQAPVPRQTLSGEIVSRGRPAPETVSAAAAPMPSMVASVSHQRLERLLDEALTKADAHKEALRYQAARHFWQRRGFSGRRRWLVLLGILVVIGGGVFFAWQAVPSLSVKVAGLRAHISAVMPSYKPDGFKSLPAAATSGAVTIPYKSTTNPSAAYDVIQTQSDLTSSLVGQNVVPKGAAVQTSDVNGNTVYIYGSENDAAWVNNGVLYTIKNKASLNSDELLNIVKGINP